MARPKGKPRDVEEKRQDVLERVIAGMENLSLGEATHRSLSELLGMSPYTIFSRLGPRENFRALIAQELASRVGLHPPALGWVDPSMEVLARLKVVLDEPRHILRLYLETCTLSPSDPITTARQAERLVVVDRLTEVYRGRSETELLAVLQAKIAYSLFDSAVDDVAHGTAPDQAFFMAKAMFEAIDSILARRHSQILPGV